MTFILIPIDSALPAVQAYLANRTGESLDPSEVEAIAGLLERCARTGEALVAFALSVGGRPCSQ
jgi:hypothetical protein